MASPTLEDAIAFAAQCHEGEVLKNGTHFILHPLTVMLDASLQTVEERMVAVLHDVVEDCDVSFDDLRAAGYPGQVVEALTYLTKGKEETYEDFIGRICAGPALARAVKLADLRHNMDLSRIPNVTQRDLDRQERYVRAKAALEEAEARSRMPEGALEAAGA